MKILYLYANENAYALGQWLVDQGHDVHFFTDPITVPLVKEFDCELIVSYTYRHIVSQDVLDFVKSNAVNIHISYLPWNRGANPNQWSFIEDTPKGVTIHYMVKGLDAGDIIAQTLLTFSEQETLASTYTALNQEAVALFKRIFPLYSYWPQMRKKALGIGTYHNLQSFEPYKAILGTNYQMTISEFKQKISSYEKNCIPR